ncbi:MAG: glycosyltransferase family 4 protein [Blastocatellia bacterium]
MKILQVCSAEQMGGGERHVADLTRALIERGHSLHLAVRERTPLRAALANLPVTWHQLGLRNALDLPSAFRLARLIRRYQIDLLHAHVARDYPLCGLAARLAPQVRLFLTRHHFHPLRANLVYRWALGRTERFLAVSSSVAAGLVHSFPDLAPRLSVIPNWLDPIVLEGGCPRDQARHILGITRPLAVGLLGQLTPLKRQDLFLDAVAQILGQGLAREAEFLLVGAPGPDDHAYAADLHARVKRMTGSGAPIRLLGYLPSLPSLLSAFDVVVTPSANEAFSLVLIEAMAAGAAVIASRTGGMAEIVEDEVTGLLVPPNDLQALTRTLARVLSDSSLRFRLAQSGSQIARKRFARADILDQIESLYLLR